MVDFGYSEKMVAALLKHEPQISLESAIDFLSRNERNKWTHRFVGTADKCEICADYIFIHADLPANVVMIQNKSSKITNIKECQVCYNEINSY
jgi:hypothetical protein